MQRPKKLLSIQPKKPLEHKQMVYPKALAHLRIVCCWNLHRQYQNGNQVVLYRVVDFSHSTTCNIVMPNLLDWLRNLLTPLTWMAPIIPNILDRMTNEDQSGTSSASETWTAGTAWLDGARERTTPPPTALPDIHKRIQDLRSIKLESTSPMHNSF